LAAIPVNWEPTAALGLICASSPQTRDPCLKWRFSCPSYGAWDAADRVCHAANLTENIRVKAGRSAFDFDWRTMARETICSPHWDLAATSSRRVATIAHAAAVTV
jgi:hypothetical protein